MPFSLFNNPSFVAIAGKVGVEIRPPHGLDIDIGSNDASSISIVGAGTSPRTSTLVSSNNFVADRGVDELDSDKDSAAWTRVCKNRRGKHPMKGIPL